MRLLSTSRAATRPPISLHLVSMCALSAWHRACERVPLADVLPAGFDGPKGHEVTQAAWRGDKLLSAAVAAASLTCEATDDISDVGTLTQLHSYATSNEMLSQQLPTLLPMHARQAAGLIRPLQHHDGGTMVEAAVAAVAESGDGDEALAELARWLVERSAPESRIMNSKGRLLNIGGTVDVRQVNATASSSSSSSSSSSATSGGTLLDDLPAPAPVYRAVARLKDLISTSYGATAREAERKACNAVLEQRALRDRQRVVLQPAEVRRAQAKAAGGGGGGGTGGGGGGIVSARWRPVRRDDDSMAANLRDGETLVEWWRRGANLARSAFHRSLMAPYAFPGQVLAVDAWTRRDSAESLAVLVAVTARGPRGEGCVYLSTIGTGRPTPAYCEAGVSANRLIEEVLRLQRSAEEGPPAA